MIIIEVLKCTNLESTGEYSFYKNLVYIGSSHKADLLFNDSNLFPTHLFLEVIDNKLLIHPNKDLDFFLIDGKRTTSIKYVKVGQQVSFSDYIVQIKYFTHTHLEDLRSYLNNKTDEMIKNNPRKLELISKIEEF